MEMTELDKKSHSSQVSKESTVKQRSSAWKRLRKRLSRKGVVEVDIDHHRYQMLECIRKGIRDTLLQHSDLGPKEDYHEEDYRHIVSQKINTEDGKEFVFESYASSVFAAVRRAVNLSEENYLNSVAPPQSPYLEFISNSKSGQDFYLTNDMQYIFKTDKKYCIDYFISILGDYLNHFLTYPHSLIVKFLGLYSINIPGDQKKYFLVMQSIFYPSHRIEERYDVKGCLAGRYQKPRPPGSTIVTVYKDQNFFDQSLDLGSQGEWFIEQLKADTLFMKELGVQDYSLLIGRQIRHVDEQKETFPNLIERLQKSHILSQSPTHNSTDDDNTADSPDQLDGKQPEGKYTGNIGKITFPKSLVDKSYLDEVNMSNRRLLPNCKNALHIIDGPEYRYFLGIIDFFTLYEYRQKTGRIIKSIKLCCGDHSTIPPGPYADRFLRFITERVK